MEPAPDNLVEIRLGGVGGQGIALAGNLLGRAASIFDGKEAVFTQTHGPEARGGASRADVIISDRPIAYPFVTHPNILAVLFTEAYERFRPELAKGGLLIVDADLVTPHASDTDAIPLPVTRIATGLGSKVVANIVLLAYLAESTGVVSIESLNQAIRATVAPRHLDLNLKAFDAGVALTEQEVDA